MRKGLVTVVVPVYKTEKYLDRCILSIVNQTYCNLEILLIDDGSPDNCPKMCDAWAQKDSRIRVVHKQNEGLGMARNTGIENANGEYICFVDSDDYIALDTIQKTYVLADLNKSELVLFGNVRVNRQGKIVKENIPKVPKAQYCGEEIQRFFLPDLIDNKHRKARNKNICLSACMCLIAMTLIQSVNWRFKSEREIISEDSYAVIWLYKHINSLLILPEALYYHCENENSLTGVYREDRFEKNKYFYIECLKMAKKQKYCYEIHTSISGLFLSLSIATMKQVVLAKKSIKCKRKLLKQIANDSLTQKALLDISARRYSKARNIFFWGMRKKNVGLINLLLVLQNARF